jgi:putative phosphoribosyl transferase
MVNRTTPVQQARTWHDEIRITAGGVQLDGTLEIPAEAQGLVLFAHGSGSSRHSSRNRCVAHRLQDAGLATLLFDLLTRDEERDEALTAHLRFDVEFLASRLCAATQWAMQDERTAALRIGYFGASTGAAAALIAAADANLDIGAIVSRGGRPDLAGEALNRVGAPTLLIVGGADDVVISLNEQAFARLRGLKRLEVVRGATHLFEEPGALDIVAELAAHWFANYLPAQGWHS